MARKSEYDQLVESIRHRLNEMAPENARTIEEAVQNDQTLSNVFGMKPSQASDYSYCPTCQSVCWHGACKACQ